ncbi:MAG: hemolysin III family protein [Planctomycetota bacterium]
MDDWYSIGGFNDPMSSISHLTGTVIFFIFACFLLYSAWNSRKNFWYSLQFSICTLFALSMSFVYHMMARGGTAREVMLRLDVAAIFVLIASTFTVFHGILFTGWKRWGIIGLMWTITVTGVTLRTVFFNSIPLVLGDGIFLLMGWIGALSSWLLWKKYGWIAVRPVFLGGVFYTIGAIINAVESPVIIDMVWGPHETFHLFVLAGLGTHWSLAWSIVDGSFERRLAQSAIENDDAGPSVPQSKPV